MILSLRLATTRPTRSSQRPTQPGAVIGDYSLLGRRAIDDFWARHTDGTKVLLVVGGSTALAIESHALESMQGKLPVPKVIAGGEDPKHGPWMALDLPPAGSAAPSWIRDVLSPDQAIALIEQAVDFAERLQEHGIGWAPRVDDFYVHEGRLGLRRLRGGRRLAKRGHIDARHVVEELGGALLAEPGTLLPPSFLHFVLPGRVPREGDDRTLAAVRAGLAALAKDVPVPADEGVGLATLGDQGLLRERHEDAVSAACGEGYGVLVVCDGVSASYRSDLASKLAADTVCRRLVEQRRTSEPTGAIHGAIREAHRAICLERDRTGTDPAGTTIVAALAQKRRIAIGWVGDSRAYWLGAGGNVLLSRDHSWLNDVLVSGVMTVEEALSSPHAHALTRCLGPLEGGDPLLHAEPDLLEFDAPGPGHVVLCSDGLWNYFPSADDLAVLASRAGDPPRPAAIARVLVNAALVQGGQDNVTVAVLAVE